VLANEALHAYKPLLPAVKTGQPRNVFVPLEKATLILSLRRRLDVAGFLFQRAQR